MLKFSFTKNQNGLFLQENKYASSSKIESLEDPKEFFISLKQNVGEEMVPLVKKGDKVEKFQVIAKTEKGIFSCIHSPTKGIIKDILLFDYVGGSKINTIVIEKDTEKTEEDILTKQNQQNNNLKQHSVIFSDNDYNKIIETIKYKDFIIKLKNSGIVGLGGAMFPTYFKLELKENKKIDTIIINGAECEPYITADYRQMVECYKELILVSKLIQKIYNTKIKFCIEDNKINAFRALKSEAIKQKTKNIHFLLLKTRYPQGSEKNIVYSATGRKIPPGKLPLDVSCVVLNVSTLKAIYDLFFLNKPLIERIITLTGDNKFRHVHKNLKVKIGTPIQYIINETYRKENRLKDLQMVYSKVKRVIVGGPMMGFAQINTDVPIIKGNNCIILQENIKQTECEENDCINCSRCVDSCPMYLMPNLIVKASKKLNHILSEEYGLFNCYECGCCSYVCPSKINHIKWIRISKKILNSRKNATKI